MENNEVRKFTRCEEYRIYLDGPHDDIKDLKHNPVPEDAMSLSELRQKSDGELLGIVNHIGNMNNKSDIRYMYAEGFGFTWEKLKSVAEFLGFIKDSGKSNSVHHSAPGIEEIAPVSAKVEDRSLRDEVFDAIKEKKPITRVSIFAFEDDITTFRDIVDTNTVYGQNRMGQAVLFGRMVKNSD